jgi:N-acetylmuramoyl-L-alanine amidase
MTRASRTVCALVAVAAAAAGAAAIGAAGGESDPENAGATAVTRGAAGVQGVRAPRSSTANAPRAPVRRAGPRRPAIVERFIPFPQRRKDEMAAYSKRHYGESAFRLTNPNVIVEHFTVNDSVSATYNTFAPDVADSELHELPGVCSHFVIARDGTIVQLVSLSLRCRHTVGLNWTSFGIEHVGFSDTEILDNRRQLAASLRLTAWLRCRHDIAIKNVIGHNENRSSPYHRENVARLKSQTHADWTKADMDVYRAKLRRLAACA